MKKVLILAYDFPPYVSVGGLRPYSWYKYLNEFDIYPIVVTRQWGNKFGNNLDYIAPSESPETINSSSDLGTIIRTAYKPNLANKIMLKYGDSKFKIVRKIISAYYEFAQFLFSVGPKVSLYQAADEYLKNNSVDVIIATGDPFILFKYASKLSQKYNIPWIADYRDPWSQKKDLLGNIILNKWNSYFEKKIVSSASKVTTVTDFFQMQIETLVKNKKFEILPNGFDPDAIEAVKDVKQMNDVLRIAYVGYIYDWHPIDSFLSIISEFIAIDDHRKIEVNFYGINISEELRKKIDSAYPNISSRINIHPKIANDVLMQKLSMQNILLLFNYYSFPGTKIYDYIGLKRVILFCYKNDPEGNELKKKFYPYSNYPSISDDKQEKIIEETKAGYIINDSKHLLATLEKLNAEFLNKGFIECNTVNVERFSRKHQVKQLADIIKKLGKESKHEK